MLAVVWEAVCILFLNLNTSSFQKNGTFFDADTADEEEWKAYQTEVGVQPCVHVDALKLVML